MSDIVLSHCSISAIRRRTASDRSHEERGGIPGSVAVSEINDVLILSAPHGHAGSELRKRNLAIWVEVTERLRPRPPFGPDQGYPCMPYPQAPQRQE